MNEATTTHRVWKLPDNVDTDALAPGAYMHLGLDDIAPHCLESVRPGFATDVQAGDAIVAGANFGVGSSREQAAGVLRTLGVDCVIAPRFAGLFFRNAINLGLAALVCEQAGQIPDGAHITIDRATTHIVFTDPRTGDAARLRYEPLPAFLQQMIDAGGLLPQLRARLAAGDAPMGFDGDTTR